MLFHCVRLPLEMFGVVVLHARPARHELTRKTVYGPPPDAWMVVLLVVWKKLFTPFRSQAVQKIARLPLMSIVFLLHWLNGQPRTPLRTTTWSPLDPPHQLLMSVAAVSQLVYVVTVYPWLTNASCVAVL